MNWHDGEWPTVELADREKELKFVEEQALSTLATVKNFDASIFKERILQQTFSIVEDDINKILSSIKTEAVLKEADRISKIVESLKARLGY